jgi:hypothetical protein
MSSVIRNAVYPDYRGCNRLRPESVIGVFRKTRKIVSRLVAEGARVNFYLPLASYGYLAALCPFFGEAVKFYADCRRARRIRDSGGKVICAAPVVPT